MRLLAKLLAIKRTSASSDKTSSISQPSTGRVQPTRRLPGHAHGGGVTAAMGMGRMACPTAEMAPPGHCIAAIVHAIDALASQANRLAFHVTLEAAPAAKGGSGIAIVAAEVRNFALRLAQAARETADRLSDQVCKGEFGVSGDAKVGDGLRATAVRGWKGDDLTEDIASTSRGQSEGAAHADPAPKPAVKTAPASVGTAEECARVAEQLQGQAETLRSVVRDLQRLVGSTRSKSPPAKAACSAANRRTATC